MDNNTTIDIHIDEQNNNSEISYIFDEGSSRIFAEFGAEVPF